MAETLIIPPRPKLAVPRPRIPTEAHSTEELTVNFAVKKSLPPSDELTVSASSYEAILAEMRPTHNEGAVTAHQLRKNEAQAELADAQEIVRRVGGRPSSQRPDKTRRKGKRDQQSSEENQVGQKRRVEPRVESEKTTEEEETELGQLEFARTIRDNPAQLTHLRHVLPAKDYQQLEARLVFWEKFEERETHLASLAQEAAVAHASAQKEWDRARELLAQSLTLGIVPKQYSLGDMTEVLRQAVDAAKHSRERDSELAHARQIHLATTFEEPSDPEPQNAPNKTDREKSPMFGLAIRLNTETDKIAKQLYAIAQQ